MVRVKRGGGYLFLIHAAAQERSSRTSSPILLFSGRFTCNPHGERAALLSTVTGWGWGWLSCSSSSKASFPKMPSSAQPLGINMYPDGSPDHGCLSGLWWLQTPAASGSLIQTRQNRPEPPMVSSGITSYSHQAVSHYPQVSSSSSLHCAHILRCSFSFISLPLSCSTQWNPGSLSVWDHLRRGLRRAIPQSCIVDPGKGHLSCSLPLPRPSQHQTGSHHRIVLCLDTMAPVW